MGRLIDADALERSIRKTGSCDQCKNQCLSRVSISKWDMHCRAIAQAPTIGAEPVRHGRWVVDDLGRTYCSKCGKRIPFFHCYSEEACSDYDEEWDAEISETRYCPDCGAKMDGGAK